MLPAPPRRRNFALCRGVEFWAKVGRAALDNPDLPASFIAESLMGLAEPREDATPFVPRSTVAGRPA